jgi:hypothetical protein
MQGKQARILGISLIAALIIILTICYSINLFLAKQLRVNLIAAGALPASDIQISYFVPKVIARNIIITIPTSKTGNVQFTIPKLLITCSLGSLLHGKLNRIDIPQLEISLQGPLMANVFAINPSAYDKNLAIKQFIRAFPYGSLKINHIRITQGDIKNLSLKSIAEGSLQLTRLFGSSNNFNVLFTLEGSKLALTINDVLIKTKKLDTQLKGNLLLTDAVTFTGELTVNATKLAIPDTKIVIGDNTIHAAIDSTNDDFQMHGTYDAAGFYLADIALAQDPLSFSGKFLADNNHVQAKLAGNDTLQYFSGTGVLNGYKLTLDLQSQQLVTHLLNLQQVLPWLTQPIFISQGQIQIDGVIGLSKSVPTVFKISGKSLSGKVQAMLFDDLDTSLVITQFSPLRSEPAQTAFLKMFNPGLPFTNLTLNYQLTADEHNNPQIQVQSATSQFAGGSLQANNFILKPNDTMYRIPVIAKNISVDELLRFSKVDGLSGTGTLNGNMLLQWDNNGLQITQGKLVGADHDNKIVYDPKKLPTAMQVKSEQLTLVLSALKNFHYKNFQVNIRNIGDNTEIVANLIGFNPDLYDGLPIKLNFTLTGQIYLILDTILIGDKFKRQIIDTTLNGQ